MSIYYPSLSSTIKNNGGTALKGGVPYENNPSSLKSFSNKVSSYFPTTFGSTVVDGVNITGSNQNLMIPVPYEDGKPIIKRTRSTLANINVLLSAGDYATSNISGIHPITSYRTRLEQTAYREGKYNYYSGKYDAGYPDNTQDDFGFDSAAYVSRSNPGNIIFLNSRNINITQYPTKTGWYNMDHTISHFWQSVATMGIGIIVTLVGFWVGVGRKIISREELYEIIETKSPYAQDKQFIMERLATNKETQAALTNMLQRNTEVMNELKIQIATLGKTLEALEERIERA